MKVKIEKREYITKEIEIPEFYKDSITHYHLINDKQVLYVWGDTIRLKNFEAGDFDHIEECTADEFYFALQKQLDKFTAYLPSDKFDDTLADLSVMNHRKAIELNTSGCAEDIE